MESIWKDTVVAQFVELLRYYTGELLKTVKILSQDKRIPDRDLNTRPAEYKAGQ
jgi:hypothetical protein